MIQFLKELFNDDNTINEKSIIGFLSFLVMIIFAIVDVITGYYNKDFGVHEFIFNSFLVLCLGSFGFGSVDKFISSRKNNSTKK